MRYKFLFNQNLNESAFKISFFFYIGSLTFARKIPHLDSITKNSINVAHTLSHAILVERSFLSYRCYDICIVQTYIFQALDEVSFFTCEFKANRFC